ncbi:hypothetical protein VTK73DRAFT_7612 [Phialemonium thermophilum]|uniref:SMP-LTD domain-containing protein n=1 Tax=Phialemonium thermophilum TaxID=223376 RepID=A0ABR3Y6D3_9PEZI
MWLYQNDPPGRPNSHQQTLIGRTLKSPLLFGCLTVLLLGLWTWPRRWALSGSPLLYFCILLGERHGSRVLPFANLWVLFATLNLTYVVCATSWLLYGAFAAATYVAIGLVSLYQFELVGNFVRRRLRALLRDLHFIDDKIALFDIPALEMDTDVDGLFVVRGVTLSLSSLSIVAQGIEVGIKLGDDMELAIHCESVQVKLLRGIWIGDCFANLKGSKYELSFGEKLDRDTKTTDEDGDAVLIEGTQPLKAAAFYGDTQALSDCDLEEKDKIADDGNTAEESSEKMMTAMTDGEPPQNTTPRAAFAGIQVLSPDDDQELPHNPGHGSHAHDNNRATSRYHDRIAFIRATDAAREARTHIEQLINDDHESTATGDPGSDGCARSFPESFQEGDANAMRAAICSYLHQTPMVPHPPQKSMKVSTLKRMSSPRLDSFIHRLPMLLRLLLSPLSYLHPIHISSITAAVSGAWIASVLKAKVFQHQPLQRPSTASFPTVTESSPSVPPTPSAPAQMISSSLQARLSAWLTDATFVVELNGIGGQAHVPFIPTYDIHCRLSLDDVMAYRCSSSSAFLPKQHLPFIVGESVGETERAQAREDRGATGPAGAKKAGNEGGTGTVDSLKQVIRLGGADASFAIRIFLLPHHEHLIPAVPTAQDRTDLRQGIAEADGKLKEMRAEHDLNQARHDETSIKMSVHARLPACFDQDLLDFVAALVKATKVVEMEKELLASAIAGAAAGSVEFSTVDSEVEADRESLMEDGATRGWGEPREKDKKDKQQKKTMKQFFSGVRGSFRDAGGNMRDLSGTMRDGLRRKVVDGIINDRWIAKMIGKATKKLEMARGEIGYSGEIRVSLAPYRTGLMEIEGEKILP